MRYLNYLFLLIFLVATACKPNSNKTKKLGRVDLEVTGNKQAQEFFDQGLAYLHSFEYLDARNHFVKAQQADPKCGMAYWGELMAYNHPLFNRELGRLAKLTFSKMGSSPQERAALFKTEMEKDLLTSVEILYGNGTKQERNQAYREHYKILAKKYPNNHEIQAFYALSLLGAPIDSNTGTGTETAASLMKDLLEQNPDHPGALHYYIHAYDDPINAYKAIEAADRYAKVAPDATHALHMPSHIYLSLGQWNDVINSNIESWNANVNARKINPSKEAGYHSLNWLQYGLLQKNEVQLATRLMYDMIEYVKTDQSILARTYLIWMKGIYMAETNTWSGDIADINVKIDDLHLTKQASYLYLEGIKASFTGDIKKLQTIIEVIARKKYIASLNLGDNVAVMCNTAGNPSIPPNQIDVDLVTVMEAELKAKLVLLSGRTQEALKILEEGTKTYENLSISFGPPVVFKPIHEMYAKLLISENQHKKALKVIKKGLRFAPRKLDLLKLKEIAASHLNNIRASNEAREELKISLLKQSREEILKAI